MSNAQPVVSSPDACNPDSEWPDFGVQFDDNHPGLNALYFLFYRIVTFLLPFINFECKPLYKQINERVIKSSHPAPFQR
jgi:hypothetical protein